MRYQHIQTNLDEFFYRVLLYKNMMIYNKNVEVRVANNQNLEKILLANDDIWLPVNHMPR